VLLLHGQPGSARDWDAVIGAISGRVAAIAVDRPGWDRFRSPGDLRVSAEAALETLDRDEIDRAVIVGLSFGGAVAAWLAANHGERVAALVLVSPAANRASLVPLDRLLGLPIVGYLASSALLSTAGLALSARRVRSHLDGTLALGDEYLEVMGRRLRARGARRAFWVEQHAMLRDLPLLERQLGRIAAPTTVIIGGRDTIVPPAAGRRLSLQIPGARLLEIASANHGLFVQHPSVVAEEIVRVATAPSGTAGADVPASLDAADG
jgi:pimeloyl-ACP methyl ester carboxylesterase